MGVANFVTKGGKKTPCQRRPKVSHGVPKEHTLSVAIGTHRALCRGIVQGHSFSASPVAAWTICLPRDFSAKMERESILTSLLGLLKEGTHEPNGPISHWLAPERLRRRRVPGRG